MKKHELFEKYLEDLRAEGGSLWTDGGGYFFIGYLKALIEHAEEDRKKTVKIDDILKAMKKACEFTVEQKEKR